MIENTHNDYHKFAYQISKKLIYNQYELILTDDIQMLMDVYFDDVGEILVVTRVNDTDMYIVSNEPLNYFVNKK